MTDGESDANAQVPPPSEPPVAAPMEPPDGPPMALSARPSRRAFLLGSGLAVVVGAGAGVGAEYWRDAPEPAAQRHAPAALRAALTAERDLIAGLDAALPGAGTAAAALRQARADHLAHERALAAAVSAAGGAQSTASSRSSATPPPPAAQSVAQLRQAEADASRQAAKRASALSGRDAALLACIAACEATHAELLS